MPTIEEVELEITRNNVGFLLAKALATWNDALELQFAAHEYADVRPSFGSALIPLFERDRLRMGELADRSGMSKQNMTTLCRNLEDAGLVRREPDPDDGRASIVCLTEKAQDFRLVAESVLGELSESTARLIGRDQLSGLQQALRAIAGGIKLEGHGER